MILPFFLLAVLFFIRFYEIIHFNNMVQKKLNDTASVISSYQYISEQVDISRYGEHFSGIESGATLAGLTAAINDQKTLNTYKQINGLQLGINVLESKINENGLNDLKATYICNFNLMGRKIPVLIGNRCYFRAWTGESLTEKTTTNRRTVYITRTGTVYHIDKNCTYIQRMIKEVPFSQIQNHRNRSGAKYYRCKSCIRGNVSGIQNVYITENGNRYHASRNCNQLEHSAIGVDISEVGNRTKCRKCGG